MGKARGGLVNRPAVKRLVKELKPGLRVSGEYLDTLESFLRGRVLSHARANGSHKTLRADVFCGIPAGRGR